MSSDNLDTSGERGRGGWTPGPWHVHKHGWGIAVRAESTGVAECLPQFEIAEIAANARLIAAAPELLEALVNFIGTVETVDPGVYRDTIDEAREAIKKATGE